MRRKYTLVTSGGQNYEKSKSFFLGQWCDEKLDKKAFIGHHWNNKFKRLRDHKELKDLYIKVLNILVQKLNKYHQKNKNVDYWEIIIGPWLILYLFTIFDRWETLRIFFKKNNQIFFIPKIQYKDCEHIFDDTISFRRKCTSNNKWNASTFFKIIKYKYDKRVIIKNESQIKDRKDEEKKQKISFSKKLFLLINKFLCIVSLKMNSIILDDLFYSSKYTLLLNLRLGQIPSLLSYFFFLEKSKETINLKKRSQMSPFKSKKKNFINYILENIFLEMPKCYLEDYNFIEKKNFSINKLHKKLIIVNTSYAFNERFKFWLAKMKNNGSKIFVTNHGDFLPVDLDGFFLDFEKNICDKYLTWNKLYKDKKVVKLPPIQFEKYKNIKRKKKDTCLIIASGVLKYACKLQCWPYAENFKVVQDFHIDLIRNLKEKVKKKIKFRTVEESAYFSITKNINKHFKNLSISNSIKTSLIKDFKTAKILVCAYPETPIKDALFSDIPFVILYPKNLYSDFNKYRKILLPLKKNKILFHDPKKLSDHLNDIWDYPEGWWNNIKTQNCIKKFKKEVIFDKKKPLKKWSSYLSKFK